MNFFGTLVAIQLSKQDKNNSEMENKQRKTLITKKGIVKFSGILLAMLIIFLWGQSMAQDTEKVKGGFKGGLNVTNLYIDDVDDENSKIGGHAGLFVKASPLKFLGLQTELLYTMKGSQVHYQDLLASGSVKYKLNYIELPVMAVINVGPLNVHGGVYGGYLIGVRVKNLDSNGNTNFEQELDRDDFNKVDWGILGGVGFDFSEGTVGLRYNYGLKEVGESGTKVGDYTKNSKNSVLNLYVGFNF
jgi:hypothetical protein